MAHRTDVDASVDVDAIARALTETDAITPNDGETLHPDFYVVDTENLPYLVSTVLALAERPAANTPMDGTTEVDPQSGATRSVVAEALRQA